MELNSRMCGFNFQRIAIRIFSSSFTFPFLVLLHLLLPFFLFLPFPLFLFFLPSTSFGAAFEVVLVCDANRPNHFFHLLQQIVPTNNMRQCQ